MAEAQMYEQVAFSGALPDQNGEFALQIVSPEGTTDEVVLGDTGSMVMIPAKVKDLDTLAQSLTGRTGIDWRCAFGVTAALRTGDRAFVSCERQVFVPLLPGTAKVLHLAVRNWKFEQDVVAVQISRDRFNQVHFLPVPIERPLYRYNCESDWFDLI